MAHHADFHTGGGTMLSIMSAICAIVSIANVQPYLTLVGSIFAIVSGGISIYKKLKRKK